jgi:tripartite-type tricarboxylate transporter receptor subunit TctC
MICRLAAMLQGNDVKHRRRRFLQLSVAAAALAAATSLARAQTYPARPVRVIVPFAPGGATDIFARLVAQKLSEQLGKQFFIENIAGASGNIGTAQAARAAPDGYTLLFAFSTHVVNSTLFEKLPYDPVKDFVPVTLAVASTAVFSVNPAVPARTVSELVALVRANPGKMSYASGGTGTQPHLAAEQLRLSLNLDLVHVPFNGGAPAVASIVAGHTPIGVSTLASAAPYISEGKLRALAITSKTRSRISPQVPTMTEAGYAQIEGDSWIGVLLPAGTPQDVVALLHRAITGIIGSPEIEERLTTLGFDPVASTPEEFAARVKVEIETWGKVIRAANIKPQ